MSRYKLIAAACGLVVTLSGCVVDWSRPQPAVNFLVNEWWSGNPTRGDNPRLPNPVTPSASNESAPQPQRDQTNTTGMGGSAR